MYRQSIGRTRFVQIPEQVPYPSRGRIDAFNGRYHGRPAILLHVYGTDPAPASYTLPLAIAMSLAWTALFFVWWALGIPLGPGAPVR